MPIIAEDDELGHTPDFSKLLDLPEGAFSGTTDVLPASTEANAPLQPTYPSNLESIDYLPNSFMGDWDLPISNIDQELGLEEPDYAKFENWIPRFIRPDKPCDYCRIRRLNCYITHGETACTPCNALFRECSLTNTRTLERANQSTGHLLDTLHVVDEDAAKEQGTLTGIKRLQSKSRTNGRTTSPVGLDDAPGSSKRNGIRFPRHAVKILRDWLGAHENNPYPTEIEKAELEEQTELKPTQIANWLANARRRQKVTEKAKTKRSRSPSLMATTPAIEIPGADKPWDELNPFERWKHSPPEHEPASFRDIANAAANSDLRDDDVSTSPSSAGRKKKKNSSNESCFSIVRAPSATSFETGQSSSLSATNSIAQSQQSSRSYGSFGSFSSGLTGKRDRRRRRRPTPLTSQKIADDKKRNFQCTFCTDTFRSKYDWTRHEKSLHLSLEKWICAPLGPIITDPASGHKRCVFCDELDPSEDHLETHNLRQCDSKGLDARTFYRKDHLRQHLRLIHNCEMTNFMENWKSTAVNINSRCGFCAQRFTVWQERVDHLTAHFKAGARMSEWKGCRGLDPAVAAQVTNAMPPYLIGMESVSPDPFTASNKPSWRRSMERKREDEMKDVLEPVEGVPASAKATCWEILTVRLGKYANAMAKGGAVLTDEMLQAEARRILYDSDDSWNQTAADNPEWLDLFKKAHGLDFIPESIGGQGPQVPEDLETYGDLGLRIPFAVQLKAFNQQLRGEEQCDCGLVAAQHTKSVHDEKKAEQVRILYRELAREGVLHDLSGRCPHSECDNNMMEVSLTMDQPTMASLRWCTHELSPDKAKRMARLAISSGDSEPTNAEDSRPRTPTVLAPLKTNSSTKAKSTEPSVNTPKKSFLQRYRYELPRERAQRFATTTGAWQDSGRMPEAVPTSTPDIDQRQSTTTGAMMEFLGGDVGQFLPFASDAQTSPIPLASTFSPDSSETSAQQAATIREIDRLIAENTQAQAQQSIEAFAMPAAEMDLPNDFMMDDLNFDYMDINFDGDFDMSMDEAFETITHDSGNHEGEPQLRFIHYNDVYHVEPGSRDPVGGIARFKTLCEYYQHGVAFKGLPNVMTLFSGDAFNPSLESSVTKGKHMVPALNNIDTTVACLGNHDLDFGVDQFQYLASLCNFPWLCANVLDPALGNDVPLGNCKRTIMLTSSNGVKVGFIGLVEREWLDTINTLPPNLKYFSASATAAELAPALRIQGAEIIVVLSHQREPNDNKLARKLAPGTVDLILGGHDHFYGHSIVNGTHLLRSGTDFKQLSYIEARRKRDGNRGWDFNITRRDVVSSIPEDPVALDLVSKLTLALKPKLEKPMGYTAAPLDARFTTVRLKESNLGNFICDLMRFHYHADCTIMASGTIRGDQIYPPGVLKMKDLMDCFPFEDPCVVLGVKGASILKALENGVGKYPALEGRFPQVSGIEFTFDPNKAEGQRCSNVYVAGEPIDLEREYTVVTRDYMARGKDGFTSLMLEKEGGPARSIISEESGLLISVLLRQYFMSLRVLGLWKNWSHHMGRHFDGVHEKLHDVHPVRGPVKPEGGQLKVTSTAQPEMNGSKEMPAVVDNAQRRESSGRAHKKHKVEHDGSHHLHHMDSESEEEHSHRPSVPAEQTEREWELLIMRKVMRKWWRLSGLPGHPNLVEEAGEDFGVHWTKAIAPRIEGRIKIVGSET